MPVAPQLRDYQLRAIQLLRERHADRPLLSLPTGGGKTSIAAEIIRSATARGHRCAFLVHRRELVDQAVARLAQFGVRAGRILAGAPSEPGLPVQVASIPTLIRRDHWPAQLVIVDECAHATSASWTKCLERYEDAWIIGLTATPIRLDGRGLGDIFGCIVEPVTTRELIDQGHLVEPVVFAPPVDLKGLKVRAGDYALPELAERMTGLVGSLTKTWQQHAHGLKTVVFAVNVKHSLKIVEAFQDMGVLAAHIDGGTATTQRAETLAALRAGDIDLVSNCMVLSEGWDLPDLKCAILARPTKSLALFRQMVGRVMRPPGPVVVLDHAGNHLEHGLVTSPVTWSLNGKPEREPTPGLKTCTVCFAINASSAEYCDVCEQPFAKASEISAPGVDNPGELVRIDLSAPRKATKAEKEEFYRARVRTACERGYTVGWARFRYKDEFGAWPRLRAIEREEYDCPGHEFAPARHGPRFVMRCEYCYVEREEAETAEAREHAVFEMRMEDGLEWVEIADRLEISTQEATALFDRRVKWIHRSAGTP